MKKYKPANLQSVKEFIQRMLDGEEFYCEHNDYTYYFNGFDFVAFSGYCRADKFTPANVADIHTFQTLVPYTIQDAIAEKPRLCWVWNGGKANQKNNLAMITEYIAGSKPYPFIGVCGGYKHAELATLEEIKQYLGD